MVDEEEKRSEVRELIGRRRGSVLVKSKKSCKSCVLSVKEEEEEAMGVCGKSRNALALSPFPLPLLHPPFTSSLLPFILYLFLLYCYTLPSLQVNIPSFFTIHSLLLLRCFRCHSVFHVPFMLSLTFSFLLSYVPFTLFDVPFTPLHIPFTVSL